jgi:hypothetical protein
MQEVLECQQIRKTRTTPLYRYGGKIREDGTGALEKGALNIP